MPLGSEPSKSGHRYAELCPTPSSARCRLAGSRARLGEEPVGLTRSRATGRRRAASGTPVDGSMSRGSGSRKMNLGWCRSACDLEPPLHADRKVPDVVASAIGDADEPYISVFSQGERPSSSDGSWNVMPRSSDGVWMRARIVAVDAYRSGGRRQQRPQHLDGRRLP